MITGLALFASRERHAKRGAAPTDHLPRTWCLTVGKHPTSLRMLLLATPRNGPRTVGPVVWAELGNLGGDRTPRPLLAVMCLQSNLCSTASGFDFDIRKSTRISDFPYRSAYTASLNSLLSLSHVSSNEKSHAPLAPPRACLSLHPTQTGEFQVDLDPLL